VTRIEESIDVSVPARAAYDLWARFESFPRFIEGVRRVVQIDPWLTHWETTVGGVQRDFDVEVIARHPGELVAWNAVDGLAHGGMVVLQPLGAGSTRVLMMVRYEPGLLSRASGRALGALADEIADDLQRFKELVESRARNDRTL
jgi:uncharacterized membrane protein